MSIIGISLPRTLTTTETAFAGGLVSAAATAAIYSSSALAAISLVGAAGMFVAGGASLWSENRSDAMIRKFWPSMPLDRLHEAREILNGISFFQREQAVACVNELALQNVSCCLKALRIIASLSPGERASFAEMAKPLLMGSRAVDRISILHTLRKIDSDQRAGFAAQAKDLYDSGLCAEGFPQIVEALQKIPESRRASAIESAKQIGILLEQRSRGYSIEAFLHSCGSADPKAWADEVCGILGKTDESHRRPIFQRLLAERLFGDPMDLKLVEIAETGHAKNFASLAEAASRISPDARRAFFSFANALFIPGYSADHFILPIKKLASIPPEARDRFSNLAKQLIPDSMNNSFRAEIIRSLASVADAETFVVHARGLVDSISSHYDRVAIIEALAATSDRARFLGQIDTLAGTETSPEQKGQIAKLLGDVPENHRGAFMEQTLEFVNGMNPAQREQVVGTMVGLEEQRDEIFRISSYLFLPRFTPAEKWEIFCAVASVPEDEREAYRINLLLALVRSPRTPLREILNRSLNAIASRNTFSVHVADIASDPEKVLRELLARTEFDGNLFPLIQYQDSPAVDSGGVTRDFVTKLFTALFSSDRSEAERRLFRSNRNGSLFLFDPALNPQEQKRVYASAGMIFANALQGYQSIQTGLVFDPVLFEILSYLTQEEVASLPQELNSIGQVSSDIYNKALTLYLLHFGRTWMAPKGASDIEFQTAVCDFVGKGIIPKAAQDIYDDATKDDFIKDWKFEELLLPILVIAQSMQKHGGSLSAFYSKPGDLQAAIQGRVDEQIILAAIDLDTQNPSPVKDKKRAFLRQWVSDPSTTQESLARFLYEVSGKRTIAPGQKIMVSSSTPLVAGFRFQTCFTSIDVPEFETYEMFKAAMDATLAFQDGAMTVG